MKTKRCESWSNPTCGETVTDLELEANNSHVRMHQRVMCQTDPAKNWLRWNSTELNLNAQLNKALVHMSASQVQWKNSLLCNEGSAKRYTTRLFSLCWSLKWCFFFSSQQLTCMHKSVRCCRLHGAEHKLNCSIAYWCQGRRCEDAVGWHYFSLTRLC